MSWRIAALKKTTALSVEEKEAWKYCLVPELISNEEDENGMTIKKFVTKQLTWRSKKVDQFFQAMDKKHFRSMSQRGQMMMLNRLSGMPSDRPRSSIEELPKWVFK